MGSMGWVECYWCRYWVYDPYIIDYVGHPLCDWCFDWCYVGGGPYEPSAQTRCVVRLRLALGDRLDDAAALCVAECLYDWFEP